MNALGAPQFSFQNPLLALLNNHITLIAYTNRVIFYTIGVHMSRVRILQSHYLLKRKLNPLHR